MLNFVCASHKGYTKHLTEITASVLTTPGDVKGTILLLQKRKLNTGNIFQSACGFADFHFHSGMSQREVEGGSSVKLTA